MTFPRSPFFRLPSRLGHLAILLMAAVLQCRATAAVPPTRTYVATWSGAGFGNTARAIATLAVRENKIQNPGQDAADFSATDAAIVGVTMTVTGAGAGNGVFTTADFSGYQLGINGRLDTSANWVGQPQPGNQTWGNPPISGISAHFLRFIRTNPAAPASSDAYRETTGNGSNLPMLLTGFAPAIGDLQVGDLVVNAPGAKIASLFPAQFADDGNLYLRATLKGGASAVTSQNNACLLRYDGQSAVVIAREGDLLFNETDTARKLIRSFGDPVYHEGLLTFAVSLLQSVHGVTPASDEAIATCAPDGTGLRQEIRKGDVPAVPGGNMAICGFNWFHPVEGGMFFGVRLGAIGVTPKINAVLDSQGRTLAYVGGSIAVDGVAKTIRFIGGPAASAPAGAHTRIGNNTGVSVVLMTRGGNRVIKTFELP